MRREFHVRFYEGLGGKFPRATRRNVYVASKRAGQRVMAFLRKRYGTIKLKVTESKSAVDIAVRRKILGYSMWRGPKGSVKLRVAPKALEVMKEKVRQITGCNGGRNVQKVVEELRVVCQGNAGEIPAPLWRFPGPHQIPILG